MLKIFKTRYDEAQTVSFDKINFDFNGDQGSIDDPQQDIIVDENKVNMIVRWGNNEALPFKDSTFDCIVAAVSLNLVENYKKQLSETHRVL